MEFDIKVIKSLKIEEFYWKKLLKNEDSLVMFLIH